MRSKVAAGVIYIYVRWKENSNLTCRVIMQKSRRRGRVFSFRSDLRASNWPVYRKLQRVRCDYQMPTWTCVNVPLHRNETGRNAEFNMTNDSNILIKIKKTGNTSLDYEYLCKSKFFFVNFTNNGLFHS